MLGVPILKVGMCRLRLMYIFRFVGGDAFIAIFRCLWWAIASVGKPPLAFSNTWVGCAKKLRPRRLKVYLCKLFSLVGERLQIGRAHV